ncbi:MAG: signal peptidase I [Actinobacteria bacterium]|nr:signal peptidase I [Actinomycetota bacterium]
MSAVDIAVSEPAPAGKHVAPEAPTPSAVRTTLKWMYRIAVALITVVAIGITVIPFMIQRSGNKLVTITSGSMTPLYPVGSTIMMDPNINKSSVLVGQVITFSTRSGLTVTHRVADRVQNKNLEGVWYQTKGDANNAPDPDLTPASAVIGLSLGEIPWWQQLAVEGQTPKGRLVVFGSLFVLVAVGEGADLMRAMRRRDEEEVEQS